MSIPPSSEVQCRRIKVPTTFNTGGPVLKVSLQSFNYEAGSSLPGDAVGTDVEDARFDVPDHGEFRRFRSDAHIEITSFQPTRISPVH
jgi:hypothetical protein